MSEFPRKTVAVSGRTGRLIRKSSGCKNHALCFKNASVGKLHAAHRAFPGEDLPHFRMKLHHNTRAL